MHEKNHSVKWPVGLAEQLKDFAQYYGHAELSFTLSNANDILLKIKRRASIISKNYDRLKNVHEFLVDVLLKTKSQTFYGPFILFIALLLIVIVIKT